MGRLRVFLLVVVPVVMAAAFVLGGLSMLLLIGR